MQHLLGFKCIGYIENEKYCQETNLQRQRDGVLHPGPIFGDIREFISGGFAEAFAGVDLITAGFPCQPFSVAGKGLGVDDPRNMWPATRDCIRIIRPEAAFLENVPGLSSPERFALYRTLDEGRVYDIEEWGRIRASIEVQIKLPSYFGRILGDLAEIGYNAKWCVLGADDVGVPHERKRFWIIANTNSHSLRKQSGGSGRKGRKGKAQSELHGEKQFMADSQGKRSGRESEKLCEEDGRQNRELRGKPFLSGQESANVANSIGVRKLQQEGCKQNQRGRTGNEGKKLADTERQGPQRWSAQPRNVGQERTTTERGSCTWWNIDPADLPDTESMRWESSPNGEGQEAPGVGASGEISDTEQFNDDSCRHGASKDGRKQQEAADLSGGKSKSPTGPTKPGLGRMDHGVDEKLDIP